VKRRTIAKELCEEGAVLVNGRPARAGREVAPGDEVTLILRDRSVSVTVARPGEDASYTLIREEPSARAKGERSESRSEKRRGWGPGALMEEDERRDNDPDA
jgi:ribosomal 50S subunit-recycling heat shock protein